MNKMSKIIIMIHIKSGFAEMSPALTGAERDFVSPPGAPPPLMRALSVCWASEASHGDYAVEDLPVPEPGYAKQENGVKPAA